VRRVLVLAYHFPPVGGAGAQRNSKFVRYLREFGYEPIVVAGPGAADDRWTPADDSLEDDVPPGTVVHRIPTQPPRISGRWRGRAERWLDLETPWARWWADGVVGIGEAVSDECDLIYASVVPYESAAGASRLSHRVGKPWVADLQDPWALDEMSVYPTWLHGWRARRTMERALASAAGIVMNTPESRDRLVRAFRRLRDRPVVSITNGFDADDFLPAVVPRTDDRFRIVHTGYLHTELGESDRRTRRLRRFLGGSSRVDIYTRSHVFLLQAVEQLRRTNPEIGERIEILLAGVASASDKAAAQTSTAVQMLGYVPHDRAIELMRTADLLFLPMQDIAEPGRVAITPGKTYEYLASRTPILAAVPDGDARDLLLEAGSAFVCRPADVDAMVEIIREQVARKDDGRLSPPPDPVVLSLYERRFLTAELAALFDRIVGGRSTPNQSRARKAFAA